MAPSASTDEIRSAYRDLARRHHPDTHGGTPSAAMSSVNEAWQVLRDPGRRARYDASLHRSDHPVAATPAQRAVVDDDEGFVPVSSRVARTFTGLPWILALVVLGLIFVFTAYAAGGSRDGSDGVLEPGSCVVQAGRTVREVPCSRPHDGMVQQVLSRDASCPPSLAAYEDPRSGALVCVSG